MKTLNTKIAKRKRKHARIRARVSGTMERPRIAVFLSNRYVYAQLIDDEKETTVASSSSLKMKGTSLVEKAKRVGQEIAAKAKEKGIRKAVFDRGGFLYSGKVKAIAEGAREGGLIF